MSVHIFPRMSILHTWVVQERAAEQRHQLETMSGGHADIAPVLYELNEILWSELGLSDLLNQTDWSVSKTRASRGAEKLLTESGWKRASFSPQCRWKNRR